MTHSPERARLIFDDRADIAEGDVTDRESLRGPMTGCDTVYINLGAKMNPAEYERIEHIGTANVAGIAAESGVRRIAMISGLNVGSGYSHYKFLAAKEKAERAVIESGIPYTIFRCCWFFESLPLFVQGGKAIVLGNQQHEVSWLAAADYAHLVSTAFSKDETYNKIYHIKGIEKLKIPDALSVFCDVIMPEAKLSFIPLWLGRIAGWFSSRKEMRGLIEFMTFYDRHPEPDIKRDFERDLGLALTTLREWAEAYKERLNLRTGKSG
jgi:uncharacterized protein YbjT (DUF2867 family)